jgi:preprotein translocase subunit YajC
MSNIWILAAAGQEGIEGTELTSEDTQVTTEQTTRAEGSNNQPAKETAPPPNIWKQLPFFVIIFVVMYMLLFRGPKKKQQQQAKMIETLKKNDRVRTIGGILGTIIDVKDNEITLKIDEANNTKMKVIPGAISTVVSEETK